jgi:hypothetical protein
MSVFYQILSLTGQGFDGMEPLKTLLRLFLGFPSLFFS